MEPDLVTARHPHLARAVIDVVRRARQAPAIVCRPGLCGLYYSNGDTFYQQCPVLKAPDQATRDSRLRLCDLVRRVIADGLDLLGIESPRRM